MSTMTSRPEKQAARSALEVYLDSGDVTEEEWMSEDARSTAPSVASPDAVEDPWDHGQDPWSESLANALSGTEQAAQEDTLSATPSSAGHATEDPWAHGQDPWSESLASRPPCAEPPMEQEDPWTKWHDPGTSSHKDHKPPREEAPAQAPVKHKTSLCRFFMVGGFCANGHRCTFAHGEDEQQGRIPQATQRSKANFCSVYKRDGFCPRGRLCQFAHSIREFEVAAAEQGPTYKTKLCFHFFKTGFCGRGLFCTYAHCDEELRAVGSQDRSDALTGSCQVFDISDPVSPEQATDFAPARGPADRRVEDVPKEVRLSVSPSDWGVAEVAEWMAVAENGKFLRYAEVFRQNEIDGRSLRSLTKEELKEELEVKELGIRKALLSSIQQLFAD